MCRYGELRSMGLIAALTAVLFATGCSTSDGTIGRPNAYNYSPTAIQTGNVRQIWWCGQARNPNNPSQDSDTIQYESINLTTQAIYGPVTVLAETPGAWDSVYTCNPKVIGGVFNNPLNDGQTYHYAMYYVATPNSDGSRNSVGVAFSNDGITWKKYPQPVIPSTGSGYGVGEPSVYNRDGKSGITMFYEDTTPVVHHVGATSDDGIHFTVQGTLPSAGMNPDTPNPLWGDMAYDPTTDSWYALFVTPDRLPDTTAGIREQGNYASILYRISSASLYTGAWQELYTIDTNLTGYEGNFMPGFVRDANGNLSFGSSPIDMYVSVSDPVTAWNASPKAAGESDDPTRWRLKEMKWWVTENPLSPLKRFHNGSTYIVSAGSVDSRFTLDKVLGNVYQAPQQGATFPFYACKAGTTDFFVSLDSACEGQRILGKIGYGYSQPVQGLNLVGIYRCKTSSGHFVSTQADCEGQKVDEFLGYILP